MSITSVASSDDDRGRDERGADAQRERALVVRRALPAASEPSRIAISSTASTPSRKRIENEKPNAIARRGDALLGQLAVDVERAPRGRRRVSARIWPIERAVADVVAQRRELELGVEHEVRVAQAQRDLDELEVVEVGAARERCRRGRGRRA